MPTNILMPALSPTMTEGKLAKWLVGEGDEVHAGDVVAEIETDKATMEVEAVDEGRIGKIVVPEGTEGVAVNAVIAVLLDEGEDEAAIEQEGGESGAPTEQEPADEEAPEEAPARRGGNGAEAPSRREANGETAPAPRGGDGEIPATPLAARMARQAGLDLVSLRGSGAGGKVTKADVEAALAGGGAAAPSAPDAGKTLETAERPTDGRIFASPLARSMAAENEIPLDRVTGSGPRGRIVKRDIEQVLSQGLPAARGEEKVPAAEAAEAPAQPKAPAEMPGLPEFDLVPHTSMRKVIARRLTESKQTVPHFYLTIDCEIDELLKVRRQVNERAPEGVKVSVNDFVIKACALALIRVPEANAAWSEDGVMRFHSADVSVAVAIPDGLITPVVRRAHEKGLATIAKEMVDFAQRARDGKLKPEEYQGGTFSISNMGMYGIKQFDAVINPPQSCILAVGAGEQRPVVKDGELAVATVMTCTLSCDHRVVDGALGARLLDAIKGFIEAPAAMLL